MDAALECVGTAQSFTTAFAVSRPGGAVGFVGVPHGVEVPLDLMFSRNIGLRGGTAPVRAYIPDLLDDTVPRGPDSPLGVVRIFPEQVGQSLPNL